MYDTLINAGIACVGLDFSCQTLSMSFDIVTYVWVPLMVSCMVVFVGILVLLPDSDEFEYEATEEKPPDRWAWADWVIFLAAIWHAIILVFAFLNHRSGLVEFLPWVFPVLFLLYAVPLGISAYRFKINHPDPLRKKTDDDAGARKRLGLD